jgi:hypothetical protein
VVPAASRQAPAPASSRRRDGRERGRDVAGSGFMAPPKPSGSMSTYQARHHARRPAPRAEATNSPGPRAGATNSPGLKSRDNEPPGPDAGLANNPARRRDDEQPGLMPGHEQPGPKAGPRTTRPKSRATNNPARRRADEQPGLMPAAEPAAADPRNSRSRSRQLLIVKFLNSYHTNNVSLRTSNCQPLTDPLTSAQPTPPNRHDVKVYRL